VKRAAVYCRISTLNHGQSVDLQLNDLRKLAEQRGFQIVKEYCDEGQSGSKNSRPALDAMLADARRGKFQTLLIWKLDRLGRSTSHLIQLLEEFRAWGVELVSFSEGLDFTTTTGKLFYTLISAFAEFERETIRERVRAGLRNAKAKGTRLGRPRIIVDAAQIASLRAQGGSWAAISARTGVSKGTAQRAVRSLPKNLLEKAPVNALFVAPPSADSVCP
jgi:DNA invertase Pin-like site-specific DNA recombinase